jgi:hypothetical protein
MTIVRDREARSGGREVYIGNRCPISPQERSLSYLGDLVREQKADYPPELFVDFRQRRDAGVGLLDAFKASPFFAEVYVLLL